MKEITNVKYVMDLGCCMDVWRISGNSNGSNKLLSSPVFYDSETDILKTKSGSIYKIISYDMNKEEFNKQVSLDISKDGYEIH